MQVLHTCDNTLCVNPNHLWLGTHLLNMRDKLKKGRQNAPAGERNAGAKLTASQVRDIRSSELPAAELAAIYGLHWSAIYRIRSGKKWRSLL
jgi:hypothetical protein